MNRTTTRVSIAAIIAAGALSAASGARSEDLKLPKTMSFTAYETGTAGF